MRAMITWLVDHGTTVAIVVTCIFIAGLMSYGTLPRESNPDITIPVVVVSTPYIGVSPEDIEGLITIPIENELAGLADVKVMTSSSSEGVSIVSIEFEPDVVVEDALQKVRDGVAKARPKLPEDAEESTINEISFNDIPIVLVTIAGDADEAVLKKLGDDLEEAATRVPGVLDATLSGGVAREIRVEIVPARLSHYGLALHDVTGAIRDENVNIPGGTVVTGDSNVLLRVPGEFTDPRQLENVAIKRVGDRPVFIRDVARVVDGSTERATYSRMNGQPSVTLSVTKRAGSNILEVASAVKALAAEQADRWPDGVTFRVLGDQSENIEMSVTDLQNNIITALILVVLVIVVFMGLRSSLFVAVAIPLSMLMSFTVLDLAGFTLNMVVLFSLMIALGMLVDNAIVIVENIYRHVELGRNRRDAAIEGTNEVAIAVAASTATTVAAFAPMVFWPGIMGEFMSFLPKTVIIVLVSSLLVALCLLPVLMANPRIAAFVAGVMVVSTVIFGLWNFWPVSTLVLSGTLGLLTTGAFVVGVASLFVKDDEVVTGGPIRDDIDEPLGELGFIMGLYRSVLLLSIRFRYLSFGGGVVMLVLTLFAYAALNHGTELFPDTEPERGNIFVRASEGTDLETTDRIVRAVEKILSTTENVDTWVAEPGVQSDGNALGPSRSATNQARITVDFLPDANTAKPGEKIRVEPTNATIEHLRAALVSIPGAEIRVEKEMMGPPVGKPIGVEVSGDDFHRVGELALEVRRAIAAVEGVTDVTDDYRVGRPEMPVRIDRGAAKRIGVSTAGIGDTLRTAVAGTKASALRDGDDEIDIVVQLAPEYRGDLQKVLSLRVPGREDTSPDTFPVPLSTVARFDFAGGTGTVKHIDQKLVVTIEGAVEDGVNAFEKQEEVRKLIEEFPVPEGYHLDMAGSTDDQEEAQSFLIRAFIIACALIMMILVTQFDSVWIPMIILVTVVLSLIGVFWGLLITFTPFGIIMTGIGVISLAGVVVNNAIVLLDYVQQLQARGVDLQESLVRAGITRFRPVMLTAITTTLGLVPMAAGVSVDFTRFRLVLGSTSAQWWGPMAVAVIFGLSFATVLTLVMVPTLYTIYDDFNGLLIRVRTSVRKPTVSEVVETTAVLFLVFGLPQAHARTLDEAFVAARSHAVGAQILSEQTRIASNQRFLAWSALSPQVSVGGSYILNEFAIELDFADSIPDIPGFEFPETEPTVVQRKSFLTADLTVSQRLFSGSALPALRSTFKGYQAAQRSEAHGFAQLKLGVAQAYYGVLAAREAEAVARAGLEANLAQLDRAQRQVEAGSAPQRSALSAQLSVAQAKRELRSASEQIVMAEERLIKLTGWERGTTLETPAPHPVPEALEQALAGIEGRADLEAADLQEQAAQLRTTAANMEWLPVVDLRFQYNYNQNTGFQDDPTSWQLAVVGRWNLWDGGARMVQASEYRSQRRMAELQTRQLRENASEDVRLAWEAYQRAVIALEAVDDEQRLAAENLLLAERSFEVGAGTALEVQQAQLLRRSADLNAIQQRMARDIAVLQLELATGRL